MRIHQMFVQGYKGVSATVTWAPAVVLFGRNDAGKSNILEAIGWAAGLEPSRADPLIEDDEAAVFALVELDELDDEDSLDADLLAALLQMRHVPPLFPYADLDEPHPDPDREGELWGGSIFLSQFPGSLLEWDPASDAEDVSARRFKIGCVGGPYSALDLRNTVGSIDEVRKALRERALAYANDALQDIKEGEAEARASFELLLDRCLRSQWIVCHAPVGVLWLPPRSEECGKEEVEAAHLLAAGFGDERVPVLDGFVRQLLSGQRVSAPFVAIRSTHRFQPWDVVRVSGSPERLDGLTREVANFVRNNFEQLLRGGGHVADPWLAKDEQGATVISEPARELCERLSKHATAIAPLFVARIYDIRVEPLEPVEWHSYGDRRIRLALVRREGGKSFDLAVAGSGLAVWAAFAVEEAMREVDRELAEELTAFIEEHIEERDEEADYWAPRSEPALGEKGRLYIFDEPELHLHPEAQEQAARWLAGRIDEPTSFLLATHALPFLSLPAPDVEYALVSRGEDGLTRAESITSDVWGVLDARASEAGVGSRAQLIQLARAFLIVEGAHDELVIRHFYGDRLTRERIFVLPIRGATKARTLIEAELLAKFDAPLIVLFDDVRAKAVVGAERPSRKDISVYSLWEMLQNWPPERKQPHVVEFVLPDIYCAVPDQCVRQVVADRGGSFAGWRRVSKDFTADTSGRGFKEFFLTESRLSRETDTTTLLKEILDRCRVKPRAELREAMDEVLDRARVNSGATDSPS